MPDWLDAVWPFAVTATAIVLALLAAGHAVLYRRDSRAAVLWVGLVWLAPIVGSILYFLFGINRIKRRAHSLRADVRRLVRPPSAPPVAPPELADRLPDDLAHLGSLQRLVEQVVRRPLVPGNRFDLLENGDAAYPAMLDAIDAAERSVSLMSFIFDADRVGRQFVDHLAAAKRRGVEVRVLVDDAGSRYSFPRIVGPLHKAGLREARFHPRAWFLPSGTLNMRNHRKLCVVDGEVGFTGSMNIKRGHVVSDADGAAVQDVHFRVQGPVVAQLQEVFVEDWEFTTGEDLESDLWFPELSGVGKGIARGIADGPDEDLDKLRWCLLGAIGIAQRSIAIVTPYFLPDPAIISALGVAAMRGVDVDILLPERINVPLVQWATRATIWQVIEQGCRVWLTPAPFDHTKIMLVDGGWTLLGSANWDARSLRLNFEFNVEAYDRGLADTLATLVDCKRDAARPLTLEELASRRLPARLRDGVARLFSPVL